MSSGASSAQTGRILLGRVRVRVNHHLRVVVELWGFFVPFYVSVFLLINVLQTELKLSVLHT